MADNDKKRYYWLKLKKDFFQQHKIKVLKSMPNGRLYALIYLELLSESTSHNGELRFSELLPYDSVTLSAVIDEDKDNLEKAIELLTKLELIEILDDQTIYMRDIQTMIGSETGQTIRKREAVKSTEQLPVNYQKNTLEYREKSLEIREKNIDSGTKTKRFVPPTLEEVTKYCNERNNTVNPQRFIDYYQSKGWLVGKAKMKDWKASVRTWEKSETKEEQPPVYDTSKNRKISDEELKRLLALNDRR